MHWKQGNHLLNFQKICRISIILFRSSWTRLSTFEIIFFKIPLSKIGNVCPTKFSPKLRAGCSSKWLDYLTEGVTGPNCPVYVGVIFDWFHYDVAVIGQSHILVSRYVYCNQIYIKDIKIINRKTIFLVFYFISILANKKADVSFDLWPTVSNIAFSISALIVWQLFLRLQV